VPQPAGTTRARESSGHLPGVQGLPDMGNLLPRLSQPPPHCPDTARGSPRHTRQAQCRDCFTLLTQQPVPGVVMKRPASASLLHPLGQTQPATAFTVRGCFPSLSLWQFRSRTLFLTQIFPLPPPSLSSLKSTKGEAKTSVAGDFTPSLESL